MKTLKFTFLIALFISLTSCENIELCGGTGTLTVKNASINTVQRIVISGTNYGTLDPGEEMEIELAEGAWELESIGLSGGDGCGVSWFNITECDEIGRQCTY